MVGAMTLSVEMITFDCAEPDTLAQWWAQAIKADVNAVVPGEFVMVERSDGPNLGIQRVPDPPPGKNRVHLAIHAADLAAVEPIYEEMEGWWVSARPRPAGTTSATSSAGWCWPTRRATHAVLRADSGLLLERSAPCCCRSLRFRWCWPRGRCCRAGANGSG